MSKTCGECKHFTECNWVTPDVIADICKDFELKVITNGDKIRQMSNEGIAAFVCGVLNDRREETFRSVLDLLNAPADCIK